MDDDDEPSPYAGLAEKIRGGKSASQLDYESRPPQLTVRRVDQGQRTGFKLKHLPGVVIDAVANSIGFDVMLDGVRAGRLYRGDKLQMEITAGDHTIWIASSYGGSKMLEFTANNGQKFRFESYIAFSGILLMQQ